MRYYFKQNGTGSTLIPIADGDHFTELMDNEKSIGACALEFLDVDGETVVTPTGGTVTFRASPIGLQWHQPSNGNGIVNAADVKPDANYTLPEFNGPVVMGKMTLAGITGATYVRAFHWRDE